MDGQHGALLDDLLAKGQIVAHGPVIDPDGSYGVSLCRLEDDQDIEAITALDPIVRNGIGRHEHLDAPSEDAQLNAGVFNVARQPKVKANGCRPASLLSPQIYLSTSGLQPLVHQVGRQGLGRSAL
ncbi:YciI family protein [Sphingomonas sp. PP-F2F-G114-C0414]|uniref:YciI family protein n=1 Tax=Sphingomonas sp. PP-F2F-G114-C0414 TaxID=2135662 RepID=UPI00217D6F0E|nr:YciI family protein [Sphingomonas sp. PP-F2F-G114-C0414]